MAPVSAGESDRLRPDVLPRRDGDFLLYVDPARPGTDALGLVLGPRR